MHRNSVLRRQCWVTNVCKYWDVGVLEYWWYRKKERSKLRFLYRLYTNLFLYQISICKNINYSHMICTYFFTLLLFHASPCCYEITRRKNKSKYWRTAKILSARTTFTSESSSPEWSRIQYTPSATPTFPYIAFPHCHAYATDTTFIAITGHFDIVAKNKHQINEPVSSRVFLDLSSCHFRNPSKILVFTYTRWKRLFHKMTF